MQDKVQNSLQQVGAPGGGQHAQLSNLESALVAKKAEMQDSGNTGHVAMIDVALQNVRKELDVQRKSVSSQVRAGQYHTVDGSAETSEAVAKKAAPMPDTIPPKVAAQIAAIRGVAGKQLQPGQVFASVSGKEPSQTSHLKANIKGLFDLVALKGQAA